MQPDDLRCKQTDKKHFNLISIQKTFKTKSKCRLLQLYNVVSIQLLILVFCQFCQMTRYALLFLVPLVHLHFSSVWWGGLSPLRIRPWGPTFSQYLNRFSSDESHCNVPVLSVPKLPQYCQHLTLKAPRKNASENVVC